MRGRKPKPTHLKLLAGNPGRRPLNTREPKPKPGLPPCPPNVKGEARAAWRRISRMLREVGVGTQLDREAMVLLVEAWQTWVTATTTLRQSGLLIKSPSGYLLQNPLLAIANKAHEQLVRLLAEFGMTPASRTRIQSWAPEVGDEFDGLLD